MCPSSHASACPPTSRLVRDRPRSTADSGSRARRIPENKSLSDMRCNEISRRDEMRLVILRVMSELTSREKPATAPTGEPTCRWEYESGPQCTRSPALRRGTRGPAPVYCEQADGPGQPVHNPLNAWRAKTRPAGAEDADPQAGRAPVTEAV